MAIELENTCGAEINQCIARAIDTAKRKRDEVRFTFNGVAITVSPASSHGLIFRDWDRAMSGYIPSVVGPSPNYRLSAAELASDAEKAAEAEAQRAADEEAYRALLAQQKARREEAMADAPEMSKVGDHWEAGVAAQKGDAYGLAVFEFAEAWARLMQKRMAAGEALDDCASEASDTANIGIGISGFMYGAAVSVLSECWIYGDELRRWHNAEYGVTDDRPGTVNPALITVSAGEAA